MSDAPVPPARRALLPVLLPKSLSPLNHGPLCAALCPHNGGQRNVMTAAWNMALDFNPAKGRRGHRQGHMDPRVDRGERALCAQCPITRDCREVLAIGNTSGRDLDHANYGDKFAAFGCKPSPVRTTALPLVTGCVAWLNAR